MENILSQYDLLKVEVALKHMKSLNMALDDVICILGGYETSMNNGRYIETLLPFDFNNESQKYQVKVKPGGLAIAISNIDMTLNYGKGQNTQSIVDFITFFFKYHEIVPEPNAKK